MARIDALQSSVPPQSPSVCTTLRRIVAEIIPEAPQVRSFNKRLVLFCVCLALCLGWLTLPELGRNGKFTSTAGRASLHNYFANFQGFSECNVRAAELYAPALKDHLGFYDSGTFCYDRKHLLRALSEGGRVGFDAPYSSRGFY